MESLLHDLRHSVRGLWRTPGFALVAILTLALGIGANTAIFSVLYGLLVRPLPYPQPDRLVGLAQEYQGARGGVNVTYRQFAFLRDQADGLGALAAATSVGFNLRAGDAADHVFGLRVSHGYFRVLGVSPALGRGFLEDEDTPGGPRAVILSHAFWMRRFAGDQGVIGRGVSLDGAPATIVGVMPEDFRSVPDVDVLTTLAQVAATIGSGQNLTVIARLGDGFTLASAGAAFAGSAAAFAREFSRSRDADARLVLEPYRDQVVADLRTPVRILFGAIGFVLLIACANVASLVMGRSMARQRELAVRAALGAGRRRLMGQLLTESLVLSLAGGAAGLLVAGWSLGVLRSIAPVDLPSAADIRLDAVALVFALGLSLATGLAFGLAPAWLTARTDLHDALKAGTGRAGGSARQGLARNALVVGEVALSLVLLVGAGLLTRTFANLVRTDAGFDPRGLVSAEVWLTGSGRDSTADIARFYADLTGRLAAQPGVVSAAVVESGQPLQRGGNLPFRIDGSDDIRSTDYRTVTPGYFATLGVPLRLGRALDAADAAGAQPAAVVNESFARRYLGEKDPLGRVVRLGGNGGRAYTVVGVAGDVRSYIGSAAPPTVFITSAQTPAAFTRIFNSWFPIHVLVRTGPGGQSVEAALPRLIHDVDGQVPVGRVRPMDDVLASSLSLQRFLMLLLGVFAGLALALAAVGLYGVIAYLVTQRTHEIGVRMALGARPADVLRAVVGRGLLLAGGGVVIGAAGALALTRFIASQLYDVRPNDPLTLGAGALLLVLVAGLASWLPARRAARVDPLVALRGE